MKALIQIFYDRFDWFSALTIQHLYISGIAIVIATMVGLLLGVMIAEYKNTSKFVLGFCNVIYTIPSISLLGFLLPLSGIGNTTAVIALTVYGLLPMIRNTFTGIDTIDPDIIEAAKGMGCTRFQLIYKVKLPLALIVILAGFRNMVVMTIALAGIASYIGAGGLGTAIYRGITTNNMAMTVAASLLIALLALFLDALIGAFEKHIKRKRKL
ncbi:MAG TPA: ABC transporter permease [Clostridiales bacterium]|nr:ABC transporter permease [Clostridiales bacterium]